jgi:signal transduction histidine kinase
MAKLKYNLAFFNLLSKIIFTGLFLVFVPYLAERINLLQEDNNLIAKREQVLALITKIGIEPFMSADSGSVFGNYNIFKEEFVSLEKVNSNEDQNFIEIAARNIEGDSITFRVLNYSFRIDGQMYLLEVGRSIRSINQTESNIKKVIWLFLISIIFITFITDLYYTGRLLKPLDRITKKLRGISDPSTFDKQPVKSATSDFVHLDNALIELMSHIDNLFQKEKEITVNISHELLTPVAVLRSNFENLLLKKDLDPVISEKIEESLKTLYRLQSLVNSLLLIARLESQQYLREDSFSVNELLSEVINEINPVAEDAGIMLRSDFVSDLIFSRANRSLVFSMFYNIVNNGVKNTPSGGNVIINSYKSGNKFLVKITDTGTGMTKEQLTSLFSRFKTRIGNEVEGTGIGLAITKSIADFHSILISVDSEVNKGTCFLFRFPENS